ncbi:GNAT family N-acetyltransferase [Streptomyces sp. QH1-20]|uniref:GNAT family N-acetyltransferase n=1 Tax=Streptomyces sp. QH1-20 TaxID=3240934 RepID=UPI0035160304
MLGFLLAYSDERLEPEEWLNHRIKTALGSFLVIKQVCVSRNAARKGVASRLYHHVLEQWPGSPVIAAVVSEPYNEASSQFHRKLGFEELTRLTPPDGRQRTAWVRRKPRESMLQIQYAVAVDLYKHEDTTNWHKLNSFFCITAGMAAAVAVTLGKDGAVFGGLLADAAVRPALSAGPQARGHRPGRAHGLARWPADSGQTDGDRGERLAEVLADRPDHGAASPARGGVLGGDGRGDHRHVAWARGPVRCQWCALS